MRTAFADGCARDHFARFAARLFARGTFDYKALYATNLNMNARDLLRVESVPLGCQAGDGVRLHREGEEGVVFVAELKEAKGLSDARSQSMQLKFAKAAYNTL